MSVFVLDKHKKPLMMTSEKRARKLLSAKKAVIHRMHPFTIRLKFRTVEESVVQEQAIKIDDGAKVTGLAIQLENRKVKYLGEIHHRTNIKSNLQTRKNYRRVRRNLHVRYRRCKFAPAVRRSQRIRSLKLKKKELVELKKRTEQEERTLYKINQKLKRLKGQPSIFQTPRPDGWIPPSIVARKYQVINTVKMIQKLTPISKAYVEQVKFDMQKLENGGIHGTEYQQGTLMGYTIREYLLEAHNRTCQYCNDKNVPLEIEHKKARSRDGSDKVSNLTIACRPCNQEKDSMFLGEWLKKLESKKRKTTRDTLKIEGIKRVMSEKNTSYRAAAVVNMTRIALVNDLKTLIPIVVVSDGATTKYNRTLACLPKTHYYDAVCIAKTPDLIFDTHYVAIFKANGRGSRALPRTNSCGIKIPGSEKPRKKGIFGFMTGDLVKANVTKGKKIGTYTGRIAVRSSGNFDIRDMRTKKLISGINHRYLTTLQRNNGWEYQNEKRLLP